MIMGHIVLVIYHGLIFHFHIIKFQVKIQGRSQDFPKGGSKFSRCLLSRQNFFAKDNVWLLSIVHTFHCIIIHIIL